jgi:hypothetical protein
MRTIAASIAANCSSSAGNGRSAFDRLLHVVRANRTRITDGLTEEQYLATVDALERMCANLADDG